MSDQEPRTWYGTSTIPRPDEVHTTHDFVEWSERVRVWMERVEEYLKRRPEEYHCIDNEVLDDFGAALNDVVTNDD